MGGTSRVESGSPANAMFIDFKCHESIESHREDALIMGWLVSQNSEPSSVCVFFHDGWFMLDDMGGRTKIQRPSRVM
jgi:hypothetical protein